jgi:hypothetical protein
LSSARRNNRDRPAASPAIPYSNNSDLVRRILAGHPETKWGPKELQELHDELEAWGE